jgi:hypothetical protein
LDVMNAPVLEVQALYHESRQLVSAAGLAARTTGRTEHPTETFPAASMQICWGILSLHLATCEVCGHGEGLRHAPFGWTNMAICSLAGGADLCLNLRISRNKGMTDG